MKQSEDGSETSAFDHAGAAASRRERQRQVTLAEITESAQRQLTSEGARGFSLRAVARDVGLAPSAIYRYFDSQTTLVATVAVNASRAAGDQMRDALSGLDERPVAERLAAVLGAYRVWALSHPGEFELLFATDQALLAEVASSTTPSWLHRLYEIPLEILLDAGSALPGATQVPSPRAPEAAAARSPLAAPLTALVREMAEQRGHNIGEDQCVALVSAWASVHGYVSLERFGQLDLLLADPERGFAEHLDRVVTRLIAAAGL